MSKIGDDYLGDGVYASWDGYSVTLDLRAQDSTTRIALEPSVFHALIQYRERAVAHEVEEALPPEQAENTPGTDGQP